MMANLYKQHYDASAPQEWQIVHNRIKDLGIVVATLNSSIHVQKDSPEEQRGNVDVQQLENLVKGLEEIPSDDLHGAVKSR